MAALRESPWTQCTNSPSVTHRALAFSERLAHHPLTPLTSQGVLIPS